MCDERKLTEKQKRWIDHYIATGNSAEAARLAGYRGNNHSVIGAQNLSKLSDYLRPRIEAEEDSRIAKANEVLIFLTSMMRGEIAEEVVTGEGLVERKTPPKDRLKAAEMLAKRYGLLVERLTVEAAESGVVMLPEVDR